MPAFYGSRPASRLPITPPDSGSGYSCTSMHYGQDPYASHASLNQLRHDGVLDYQPGYLHPTVAPAPGPPAYSYSSHAYQGTTNLPPISSYYEPIGAPILPPLRVHDRMPYNDEYQRRVQQEQQNTIAREQQHHVAKEEKTTGGVSAKLDYDMERMTDFVTDATMTIFQHRMQSPPSFRKWVHQVLSATRLPSSTIMLSLHYLNDRVAHFPETVSTSENQIYRLLAVALILASKFLDDNTFINRSWSDVTAIKVQELNTLEAKWLELIQWELHVSTETAGGLQAWLRSWQEYPGKGMTKLSAACVSSLDAEVHRPSALRDHYSPYSPPHSVASSRTCDGSHSSRSQYANSSYDPWRPNERQPFSGYYGRHGGYGVTGSVDDYHRQASSERARQPTFAYSQPAPPTFFQPAFSTWDQPWNAAHSYDCRCTACAYPHHYRPYPVPTAYAAQTVMG